MSTQVIATSHETAPAPPAPPASWITRLTRVTSSGKFIPEIDGFRFIAVAGVFLLHSVGQVLAKNNIALDANRRVDFSQLHGADWALVSILWTGGFGVYLFFVISGFILALPFAEHHLLGARKPRLGAYYLRRVTRLEPPYILNLILCAGAVAVAYGWSAGEILPHLSASMIYLHNQIFGESSTINGVTWSLEIEIQFYLLAPFLTLLFCIRNTLLRRSVLLSLVLAFALLNNFIGAGSFRYQASILNAVQYFLAGFVLADLYLASPRFLKSKHALWDLVALLSGVAMIAAIHFYDGPEGIWSNFPFPLPFLALLFYIAGFKSILFNKALRAPPVFLIGGMCYTIYLYHGILLIPAAMITRDAYFRRLPFYVNYPVQCLMQAALILPVCILFFALIERPCMMRDWPQKLWHRIFGNPLAVAIPPAVAIKEEASVKP